MVLVEKMLQLFDCLLPQTRRHKIKQFTAGLHRPTIHTGSFEQLHAITSQLRNSDGHHMSNRYSQAALSDTPNTFPKHAKPSIPKKRKHQHNAPKRNVKVALTQSPNKKYYCCRKHILQRYHVSCKAKKRFTSAAVKQQRHNVFIYCNTQCVHVCSN